MSDATGVRIRPLAAEDLDEADRIGRAAFGTFIGVPEPERFFGDAEMARTRWAARTRPGTAPLTLSSSMTGVDLRPEGRPLDGPDERTADE